MVPDQQRGQAIGIGSSGLLAVQGFGILIGGVVANIWGVNAAVAGAGLLGTVLAIGLSWSWQRTSARPHPEPAEPIRLPPPTERVAEDRSTA
jgi:predicted MFS family arabinose efflux permease